MSRCSFNLPSFLIVAIHFNVSNVNVLSLGSTYHSAFHHLGPTKRHNCIASQGIKAGNQIVKGRAWSPEELPHPPFSRPSCTEPLMLSSRNTGTLSFLSMTHTSTVKLWGCMDAVKDTWEKSTGRFSDHTALSDDTQPLRHTSWPVIFLQVFLAQPRC